jgi:hypothetical protein
MKIEIGEFVEKSDFWDKFDKSADFISGCPI